LAWRHSQALNVIITGARFAELKAPTAKRHPYSITSSARDEKIRRDF
jgi:hypothetical protein